MLSAPATGLRGSLDGPPGRWGRRNAWLLGLLLLIATPSHAQPAAPPSVQYSGWFHVMWGDGFGGPATVTARQFLIDDRGRWHHLRIDAKLLTALGGAHRLSRSRVTVTGRPVASAAVAGRARPSSVIEVAAIQVESADTHAAAPLAVSGAQPWVTILCRFADSPTVTPRPVSYFEGLMGSVAPGMDHYWQEVSYGNVNLGGSVVAGWYDLPRPRSYYVSASNGDGVEHLDFQRTVEDCAAAADADVFLPDFTGINLMFNEPLDCCSWGGGATLTRDGQTRFYRVTWLPPWAYAHQYVIAHEMGHGFGLPHSSGPYTSTYDSDWDPMSGGGLCSPMDPIYGCVGVHTISFHKDMLGWVPPSRRFAPTPGQSETIAIERLARPDPVAGYLMAELPIPGSTTRFYTVEARRLAGYDGQIPGQAVVIHQVDTTRGDREAQVVDPDNNGNPNDAGATWLPGETFSDPANMISVSVDGMTTSGFQVTIVTSGFRLGVAKGGVDGGTVKSTPAGIDCGPTCAATYKAGAPVTLIAATDAAAVFNGWTGCDTVTGNTCTVTMSADRSVTASFTRQSRLSVATTGIGAVRSVPPGVDCGSVCSATYPTGTSVTLLASAGPQSVFAGWSGDADCANGTVSMAADTACTASFRPVADLIITSLSDPPAIVRAANRFAVTDTVLNQGLAAAGHFLVRYYLSLDPAVGPGDRLLLGKRAVPSLAAGAASAGTAVVWIPLGTAPGTYYLLACADDTQVVAESDDGHNCRPATGRLEVSSRRGR